MKIVFVVDDNDTNLAAAKAALDGVYRTFSIPSGEKMLNLAERIRPDLILLDIAMPEMDGFEAMRRLKADAKLKSIPVIFLTAMNDAETEIRGFEMGALDFISKPFSPPVLIKRIEMFIEMDKLIKERQRAIQKIHNATISVIADLVETRGDVTSGHTERTQAYLKLLIGELLNTGTYVDEITSWDKRLLFPSAQLHDVGKITISDSILNKPGKLSEEEFETVKQHCIGGERIIDTVINKAEDDGFLLHAKKFAGSHHERWDGTGYPRKLRGENIPLEGRLMAIADVYDALISERPYKKALSHEEAVAIITGESGTHFDPKIVEAFLNVANKFWLQSVIAHHK